MAIAVKPAVPSAPARPGADARFEGLVLDFLSYLELERGLSRNTLNAYRTDLLQYGEFLAAHYLMDRNLDRRVEALSKRPPTIGPVQSAVRVPASVAGPTNRLFRISKL